MNAPTNTRDDFAKGQVESVIGFAQICICALKAAGLSGEEQDHSIPDVNSRRPWGDDSGKARTTGLLLARGEKEKGSADRRQRGFRLLFLSPFLNPNAVCAPTSISGE
jgi:hypothetical protein